MRVIFAGTPGFAAHALKAILDAGHEVPLVLTQPDRPAGRNQRLSASPVKQFAEGAGLPVYQPERLKTEDQRGPLLAICSDVMVVAAYGLILPGEVLAHPAHGCLNIHASLLPRWRGAAPIQRAILAGDAQSGVCIMQMGAGLDTGPVISRHVVDIATDETSGTLHDRLAAVGATAIVATLVALARDGHVAATAQSEAGVTYAAKVEKREAQIDWSRSAIEIDRQIRAFNPAPGAATTIEGAILKIWRASPAGEAERGGVAGELVVTGGAAAIRCGDGRLLALEEVQPASGRRMIATEYLKGRMSRGALVLGT